MHLMISMMKFDKDSRIEGMFLTSVRRYYDVTVKLHTSASVCTALVYDKRMVTRLLSNKFSKTLKRIRIGCRAVGIHVCVIANQA